MQLGTDTGNAHQLYSLEVPANEVISGIRVKHSAASEYPIQHITFDTRDGTEIEFKAKAEDGNWTEFKLEEGELIVGCYG